MLMAIVFSKYAIFVKLESGFVRQYLGFVHSIEHEY